MSPDTWRKEQERRSRIRTALWDKMPDLHDDDAWVELEEDISVLDGCFTAKDLRMLADAMDEFEKKLKNYSMIIMDDPHDESQDVNSEEVKQKVLKWWEKVFGDK